MRTKLFFLTIHLLIIVSYTNSQVVDSIVLFKTNAGCPKWFPVLNEFIAYHTIETDNNYDIHIMDADGSNDTCITCNHPNLPNRHIGNHSWYKDGNWLAFIAEKSDYYLDSITHGLAKPGIGWNCDVFIISTITGNVFQITDLPTKMGPFDTTPITGVLGPHFSPDGTKFTWGERIDTCGTYNWGEYVIRIADFQIVNDTPVVSNIQTLQPVSCRYLETNSFTSDSQKLLFCGNMYPDQTEYGIDIFSYDLSTTQIDTLFHTQNYFDECAHISPSDSRIAFLSTDGYPNDTTNASWWEWAKGEFWIMNADGTNRNRLTNFNVPGFPEYTGKRICPAMVDWNLDETVILAGLAEQTYPSLPKILEDKIYKIYLTGLTSNQDNQLSNTVAMDIYPNPSSDGLFSLSATGTDTFIEEIYVYDITGKNVRHISNRSQIGVGKEGIYFIMVVTNKGTFSEKVLFLK